MVGITTVLFVNLGMRKDTGDKEVWANSILILVRNRERYSVCVCVCVRTDCIPDKNNSLFMLPLSPSPWGAIHAHTHTQSNETVIVL